METKVITNTQKTDFQKWVENVSHGKTTEDFVVVNPESVWVQIEDGSMTLSDAYFDSFRNLAREQIAVNDTDKSNKWELQEFIENEKNDIMKTFGEELTFADEALIKKAAMDAFDFMDLDESGDIDDKEYAAFLIAADMLDGNTDGKLNAEVTTLYSSEVPKFYNTHNVNIFKKFAETDDERLNIDMAHETSKQIRFNNFVYAMEYDFKDSFMQ